MDYAPLTKQQIFDNALFGVRGQKYVPSMRASGGCVYRGVNGRKCGIGHSIPDEVYSPEMEKGIMGLLPKVDTGDIPSFKELHVLFGSVEEKFLVEVQSAHDNLQILANDLPERRQSLFETGMAFVAQTWGLTYTPPKTLT